MLKSNYDTKSCTKLSSLTDAKYSNVKDLTNCLYVEDVTLDGSSKATCAYDTITK